MPLLLVHTYTHLHNVVNSNCWIIVELSQPKSSRVESMCFHHVQHEAFGARVLLFAAEISSFLVRPSACVRACSLLHQRKKARERICDEMKIPCKIHRIKTCESAGEARWQRILCIHNARARAHTHRGRHRQKANET